MSLFSMPTAAQLAGAHCALIFNVKATAYIAFASGYCIAGIL